jgi:hypothetical protein
MDSFGSTDPKKMPLHLFSGAHDLDYSTAIRANTAVQDCSVCPRHWYIDARFRCTECEADFLWSAEEQRVWFETYRFWVDSRPRHCRDCRAKRRDAVHLRQEYDALVNTARSAGTSDQKRRTIEIVDALESYLGRVPDKLSQTRELFRRQLAKQNPNERSA